MVANRQLNYTLIILITKFKSVLVILSFFWYSSLFNYGGSIGPLAAIDCEPRQARKGAAVTIDSSAEVRLLEPPP